MAEILTLQVARELQSPNRWQGRHWRYKHRETLAWEEAVWETIALQAGARTVWAVLQAMNAIPTTSRRCTERRRVTITRVVPSRRQFIRDEDNLRFSTKPVNDALTRLGLIKDDSRAWLEQPMPEQLVSPDGEYRTDITIGAV